MTQLIIYLSFIVLLCIFILIGNILLYYHEKDKTYFANILILIVILFILSGMLHDALIEKNKENKKIQQTEISNDSIQHK